jgi:hypothetical protein
MIDKKNKYKIILILTNFIASIGTFFLFFTFIPALNETFEKYDTAWILMLIILIRIINFVLFSSYLYVKWFKQEVIYTSDGFFLFAVFFNIFIFGKLFDVLTYISYASDQIGPFLFLFVVKIRYFIIILEAIPLLFIGLEVVVNYIKLNVKSMSPKQSKRLRFGIILTFLSLMSILIILGPNLVFILTLLPILVFGTILGIVIMFLFMYKMKLLSQANGLIIGIGFIFFMISSILRSILSAQFNPSFIIISEIIEMSIFFVIFLGFIKKPNYTP